jgi:hypothetical protein
VLATFTPEDWVTPLRALAPWLLAAGAGVAAMITAGRWTGPRSTVGVALVGCAAFGAAASLLTARPEAAVREETATRGAINLISEYDGPRHRQFDYGTLQKATPEDFLRLTTVTLRTVPAGPVTLPPGAYDARVWFGGGQRREGEIVVSSSARAVFGRAEGALSNPAIVPFELPARVGRVSVNVPDRTLAASVVRVEIAPTAIVPRSDREEIPVRAVESIAGRPGSYILYTDEHAFPEGGVFWTRGTEATTVLVTPAGASRIILTLHRGPVGGEVRISVAGTEHVASVQAGSLTRFEAAVPAHARLVPITIQSSGMFRPSEVDPASDDVRRLGCQVRVELE